MVFPTPFLIKKWKKLVAKIIHGMSITNKGALRNPNSLDFYEKIKEELKFQSLGLNRTICQ